MRRGREGGFDNGVAWDKVPDAPARPENWFNPTVPPYSTENLGERFHEGVPSYVQGSEVAANRRQLEVLRQVRKPMPPPTRVEERRDRPSRQEEKARLRREVEGRAREARRVGPVYHCSHRPFAPRDGLMFFSDKPRPKAFGNVVSAAYLEMRRPFLLSEGDVDDVLRVMPQRDVEAMRDRFRDHLVDPDGEFWETELRDFIAENDMLAWQERPFRDYIERAGFDSVVGSDSFGGATEYAVFHPSQVRLVEEEVGMDRVSRMAARVAAGEVPVRFHYERAAPRDADAAWEGVRHRMEWSMRSFAKQYARDVARALRFQKGVSFLVAMRGPYLDSYSSKKAYESYFTLQFVRTAGPTWTADFWMSDDGARTRTWAGVGEGRFPGTRIKWDRLPSSAEFAAALRRDRLFMVDMLEYEPKADNKAFFDEVSAFFARQGTWFEESDRDDEHVLFGTRAHGDVGNEEPGAEDVREGRRLKDALWREFKDRATVSLETVDEWVDVEVRVRN